MRDEILQPDNLIARLRSAGERAPGADAVSRYVFPRLSPRTRELVMAAKQNAPPTDSLVDSVVADLDTIITGPCIYDRSNFAGLNINPGVHWLLQYGGMAPGKRSPRAALINRELLEAAYPAEIKHLDMTDVAVDPQTNRVYVTVQAGNVEVVDGQRDHLIGRLPSDARGSVAVDTATHRLYVLDHEARHVITVVDSSTYRRLGSRQLNAQNIILDPARNLILACLTKDHILLAIDGTTLGMLHTVPFPKPELTDMSSPNGYLAVDSLRGQIYTIAVCGRQECLYSVDEHAWRIGKSVPAGLGSAALVFDKASGRVIYGDTQSYTVTFLAGRKLRQVARFRTPLPPQFGVVDDADHMVFIGCYGICIEFDDASGSSASAR